MTQSIIRSMAEILSEFKFMSGHEIEFCFIPAWVTVVQSYYNINCIAILVSVDIKLCLIFRSDYAHSPGGDRSPYHGYIVVTWVSIASSQLLNSVLGRLCDGHGYDGQ